MTPTIALSLPPALLVAAGLITGSRAIRRRGSKARPVARGLIAAGLLAWLYLGHRLAGPPLAIGIGGWLLAAVSLAFRGTQAERLVWTGTLPLSVILLLVVALVPDDSIISFPWAIGLIGALDASYIALVAAWSNAASVQRLKTPGFGQELEFFPELWLLRGVTRAASAIAFALLAALAVGAALSQPASLLRLAIPLLIAALLCTRFLPLNHKGRAYGNTALFLALLPLVTTFFWKG